MKEWILIFIFLGLLIYLFMYLLKLKGEVEDRAMALFNEWKEREEKNIKESAIQHSLSTIIGKVGEHIAPVVIFANYGINPKDLRFLGTPVDYIGFKGLSDGELEEILFIEVKSGKTKNLTERERQIKDIVEARKVKWVFIHLPEEIEKLRQTLF